MLPVLLWMQMLTETVAPEHMERAPTVELHWEGGTACPDDAHARRRLADEVARAETSRDEHVVARVHVAESEDGIEATLDLATTAGQSQRVLSARRCEEIADAVGLIVATTLDPFLDLRTSRASRGAVRVPLAAGPPSAASVEEVEPLPPDSAPDPVAPSLEVRAKPEPPPVERSTASFGSFGTGVTGGLLPRAGPHLELVLGVKWRWLRGALLGHYAFARRHALPSVEDASIVLHAWSLGLIGCGVMARNRVELPLCTGIEGGRIGGEGRGSGLAFASSAARPWLGVVARTGVHVGITPHVWLALDVHGDGIVWRPAFHVEGAGSAHVVPRVAGRAILGIGARWP